MTHDSVSRRAVLSVLATGGAASLAAACRATGSGDQDAAIRAWFRQVHDIELVDDALGPIREYLQHQATQTDPSMQPPLLFDPEVDVG
jgi:hypothetical protein